MKVFVYGTLRKGEWNAHLLAEAKCIAEQAWTKGMLFDSGFGYPVLKASTLSNVYGELYEVTESELEKLDILEGYRKGHDNNLFERVVQTVHTDQGVHEAYVYIGGKGVGGIQKMYLSAVYYLYVITALHGEVSVVG